MKFSIHALRRQWFTTEVSITRRTSQRHRTWPAVTWLSSQTHLTDIKTAQFISLPIINAAKNQTHETLAFTSPYSTLENIHYSLALNLTPSCFHRVTNLTLRAEQKLHDCLISFFLASRDACQFQLEKQAWTKNSSQVSLKMRAIAKPPVQRQPLVAHG